MPSVFGPALEELAVTDQPVLGPRSFRDYVTTHELDATRTARYISVDSLADLEPGLREAGVMVLRTGSAPNGTGTAFLLVDGPNGVTDFFLQDADLFDDLEPGPVPSTVEQAQLLNFSVLPSLSETSFVNLGLASGALSHALDLDTTGALAPPATGRSTFTFDFRPHSDIASTVTHRTGQVETDTLFVERRNGEPTLFVVEAKTGPRATLAKHKLVYPILAVADSVPSDIEIVPVYLRCRQTDDTITFDVAECSLPDPRMRVPGVDELEVVRSSVITLDVPDV
ncbi:DUF6997 domain-containing protein [Natrialba sp. SSL1]|uniref:DUF6997 domain-containing protein n=1 Tax=Natrialba sp. SSL1 TaxID=1869245 RepID=UPI0008F7E7B7|nr:hypothetical protein [Natrialba sp. SSL1]OIB56069.1 hypothetical protein BBD46_19805 [Natrialba sp. SSL1]